MFSGVAERSTPHQFFEEVPDSEPERVAARARDSGPIVISSDEDEDDDFDVFTHSRPNPQGSRPANPPRMQPPLRREATMFIEPSQTSTAEASQLLTVCTQTSSESQCSTNASMSAIPPSSPVAGLSTRLHELDEMIELQERRDKLANHHGRKEALQEPRPSPANTPKKGKGRAAEISQEPSSSTNNRGQVNSPGAGSSRATVASPRPSKSKNSAPQNQTLRDYAQELFNELSVAIFEERIGGETPLSWNNRLTRTAGRAHYSRHSDGSSESRIELSTKVVDREERVRNTLAHEMCHLAVWMIDGIFDPEHGANWNLWARKVMKYRPDIFIKPTHTYQIDYPFNWECGDCNKVYGRYTNSIDPTQYVCVCQGELVPVENRTTHMTSRHEASEKAQQPRSRGSARKRIPLTLDTTMDMVEDNSMDNLICGMGSFTISDAKSP